MIRWAAGKEGGKVAPPEALILQIAEHFHLSPVEVEEMPFYWFNRMVIWMDIKAAAFELNNK